MIRNYLNGFRPDFSVIKFFQKKFWEKMRKMVCIDNALKNIFTSKYL